MKVEMRKCPSNLKEKYGFSWMEHVLAIPSPLVNVTTYKSNGKTNSTMQSWCTFVGEKEYHVIFSSVNKSGHMYKTIKETGCCVVNIPSTSAINKCMNTIKNNDWETCEITKAGLTITNASIVNAPMIEECIVNLECELKWEHDLMENGKSSVMCLKVVNVWMNQELFDENKQGRYGKTGYLYNIHSPQNPLTGEEYETYTGIIKKNIII